MLNIDFLGILQSWAPFILTLGFFIALISILKSTILSKNKFLFLDDRPLIYGLIVLSIAIVFTVSIIMVLPINDSKKGQLMSLVGIIFAASVSLSSTSFLGNVMAGLMLKVVKSFKAGDFIEVDDFFGKVSELRLLHTEIQTESRDLLTIPNLFLVTKPMKVVRDTGTIVSATVSLGYEVPRHRIEKTLCAAAVQAGFKDPFVLLTLLGDFSVHYKLSAFLENTKFLVSAKSKLISAMLDGLHLARIEIVSPNFMNQRQVNDEVFIPKSKSSTDTLGDTQDNPEKIMFEKADMAESNEKIKERIDKIQLEIKGLTCLKPKDEAEMNIVEKKLDRLRKSQEYMTQLLQKRKEEEN